MDDFLEDIIEGVLDLIIDGIFGSKRSYKSSKSSKYSKSLYNSNNYSNQVSRNYDGTPYKVKKPKPMYGPGSHQEDKDNEAKQSKETVVASAYMGATIAKKTEPITKPDKLEEPINELSKIEEPITASIKKEETPVSKYISDYTSDYDDNLTLPEVPTISADFDEIKPVPEVAKIEEDIFHQTSRKDAIMLEIMLISYMFQEDDGKISGKEKRAIKKHFSQYRGELDGSDINEIMEMQKLDKSLTNIRAYINSNHIDNTTITNSIRACKEVSNGVTEYNSIISRIERALLETMGF